MVPVVRHAEARDLWSTRGRGRAPGRGGARAARRRATSSPARRSPSPASGALGGIVTTPVINHPEVAIVGVNRIVERPVMRDGAVVPRQMMNLSSSFDHRVVDGCDAARVRPGAARRCSNARRCCSSSSAMKTDATTLLVIGGGPGGYVAAIRAGQLGIADDAGRRRAPRRHLPQRRLHSVEGADPRRRRVRAARAATRATTPLGIRVQAPTIDLARPCAGRTASCAGSPAASRRC